MSFSRKSKLVAQTDGQYAPHRSTDGMKLFAEAAGIHALGKDLVNTCAVIFPAAGFRNRGREDHDAAGKIRFPQGSDEIQSIHSRHVVIGHDTSITGEICGDGIQGGLCVGDGLDEELVISQKIAKGRTHERRVVEMEYAGTHDRRRGRLGLKLTKKSRDRSQSAMMVQWRVGQGSHVCIQRGIRYRTK